VTQVIVLSIAILLIAGGLMARRAELARRRSLARTIELVVDAEGVERHLADGRVECARWVELDSVEVVCTPVATADGAKAFLVLAESVVEGDERGCLVPLGVGHEAPDAPEVPGVGDGVVSATGTVVGGRPVGLFGSMTSRYACDRSSTSRA